MARRCCKTSAANRCKEGSCGKELPGLQFIYLSRAFIQLPAVDSEPEPEDSPCEGAAECGPGGSAVPAHGPTLQLGSVTELLTAQPPSVRASVHTRQPLPESVFHKPSLVGSEVSVNMWHPAWLT